MGALSFPSVDKLISQFEGFGTPQASTITLANNPGALAPGSFASQHGATGMLYTSGGQPIASFPSLSAGTSAEDALVASYANQGFNIADLVNKWSPPNAPGNTQAGTDSYVNYLASGLNASPTTPVIQAESAYDTSNNVQNALGTVPPVQPGQTPGSTASSGPGASGSSWLPSWMTNLGGQFSFGRIAAFALGLILIGVGLWMFKPVQQTVSGVSRAATRAGELFAE